MSPPWLRGQNFGSQKWHVSASPASRLRDAGGCLRGCAPLRSWSFFENVGANEAIWCTFFHHVKHLTACLLLFFFFFFFYFRTGLSKKWRGHAPSRLKSGGPLAPLVPPPMLGRNQDWFVIVFSGGAVYRQIRCDHFGHYLRMLLAHNHHAVYVIVLLPA